MKALSINRLTCGYRGRSVIKDLQLPAFAPGQMTAIIGPNGAGKSTLVRALAGLLPASGQVLLGEDDLMCLPRAKRSQLIGYMPQGIHDGAALSALEALIVALRARDAQAQSIAEVEADAMAMLSRLGIAPLALRPISELSGGQKQLVSLAQAMIGDPQILLLDEPTSALDPRHQIAVMRQVQAFAKTMTCHAFVVLHDLNLAAAWATNIVLLKDGAVIASGRPEEVMQKDTLSSAYDAPAIVEATPLGRLAIWFE